jgi:hypothetical protein
MINPILIALAAKGAVELVTRAGEAVSKAVDFNPGDCPLGQACPWVELRRNGIACPFCDNGGGAAGATEYLNQTE